jgi:CBS domain-containing protein
VPVLAKDIAEPFPTVTLDTNAYEAAKLLAGRRLPGLIVIDAEQHPVAILPGSQVLNFAIPRYVQDDPRLAQVYDERAADELCAKLETRTVREVLPAKELRELEVVDGRATVMEVAAVMARQHSPVIAVIEKERVIGAITVSHLLNHILPQR